LVDLFTFCHSNFELKIIYRRSIASADALGSKVANSVGGAYGIENLVALAYEKNSGNSKSFGVPKTFTIL